MIIQAYLEAPAPSPHHLPSLCVHTVWSSFSCQSGAMGFDSLLSREEHSLYIPVLGVQCATCLVSQPLCSIFLVELLLNEGMQAPAETQLPSGQLRSGWEPGCL